MLRFGYNTNGFAHHTLEDAIEVISHLGYAGIALTLDVCHCNPFSISETELLTLKANLSDRNLSVVIETGARFLLNPFHKHEPTLISNQKRSQRIDFLKKAIDIAALLNAEGVTFFSGIKADGVSDKNAWSWLVDGCNQLCDYALKKNIPLGFESEPGMFIDNLTRYDKLQTLLDFDNLNLTLDIGHVKCTESKPISDVILNYFNNIISIHIEDIKDKTHNHLMFGHGDIDFSPVLKTLNDLKYSGLINVELSRHSHMAPIAAQKSINFLQNMEK